MYSICALHCSSTRTYNSNTVLDFLLKSLSFLKGGEWPLILLTGMTGSEREEKKSLSKAFVPLLLLLLFFCSPILLLSNSLSS